MFPYSMLIYFSHVKAYTDNFRFREILNNATPTLGIISDERRGTSGTSHDHPTKNLEKPRPYTRQTLLKLGLKNNWFATDGWTIQQTNRRTDTPSYRIALSRLKI